MKFALWTTPLLGVLVILLGNFVAANDICNWDGAIPKLYTEYYEDSCPVPNHLDDDMACTAWDSFAHDCGSYCQMRTTFVYGPEQPFVRVPACRAPLTCKISSNIHQGYSWKAKLNGNFKSGPLTIGITGGFSKKYSKGISSSFSVHLSPGQCGYFAFVAIVRQTCGNSCVYQVARYKVSDGYPDQDVTRGIVIFVFTDCVTMEPLPDDQQDPAYRQPGVKLPRDPMRAYAQFMKKDTTDFLDATSSVCLSDNKAQSLDCLDAIGQLLETPAIPLPKGKTGTSEVLSKSNTCSITVDYLTDIGDLCSDITYVDVAAAAQGLYDNCQDGKGNMGGKHSTGTMKCPAAITIKKT